MNFFVSYIRIIKTRAENVLDSNNQIGQLGGGPECLELGIEIDNYTYVQFDSNCYESVEWALALLAGVSEVYMAELNDLVELQARYVNVWESKFG